MTDTPFEPLNVIHRLTQAGMAEALESKATNDHRRFAGWHLMVYIFGMYQ